MESEKIHISDYVSSILAAPKTHQPVRVIGLSSGVGFGDFSPIERSGFTAPRTAKSSSMLVADDAALAFPLSDGFPVLMWPDAYLAPQNSAEVDLQDRTYWEAYAEMAFYNSRAMQQAEEFPQSALCRRLQALKRETDTGNARFPEPVDLWVDNPHDSKALLDAYGYLAPIEGKIFAQIGGDGRYAVMSLLAGAAQAILITPMLGEAKLAHAAARMIGVEDRFSCVLGLGEELPLIDGSVDVVFSPACMHHMRLDLALNELRRVLKDGGRFAAFDPWKAPFYAIGTKIFGKRGSGLLHRCKSVFCTPLTPEKIAVLDRVFPVNVQNHHGPFLRYPFLAAEKLGLRLSVGTMLKVGRIDDFLGEVLQVGEHWGGSLMFGGEKSGGGSTAVLAH